VFENRGGNLLVALRWSSSVATLVSCCFLWPCKDILSADFIVDPIGRRASTSPWLLALDGRLRVFFNLQFRKLLCTSIVGSFYGDPSSQFSVLSQLTIIGCCASLVEMKVD
jgi:hypothetical protein